MTQLLECDSSKTDDDMSFLDTVQAPRHKPHIA